VSRHECNAYTAFNCEEGHRLTDSTIGAVSSTRQRAESTGSQLPDEQGVDHEHFRNLDRAERRPRNGGNTHDQLSQRVCDHRGPATVHRRSDERRRGVASSHASV